MMNLTNKEKFCLAHMNSVCDATSWEISQAARDQRKNTTVCWAEWADSPLRSLRKKCFIEKTQERRNRRAVWRLTDAGVAAALDLEEE